MFPNQLGRCLKCALRLLPDFINNGNKNINITFSYRARVFSFDLGVIDKLDHDTVAASQKCVEVDGFLWRRRQSSEEEIIVKLAQVMTEKSQPSCGLARMQWLVFNAHGTLKTGDTPTNIERERERERSGESWIKLKLK